MFCQSVLAALSRLDFALANWTIIGLTDMEDFRNARRVGYQLALKVALAWRVFPEEGH